MLCARGCMCGKCAWPGGIICSTQRRPETVKCQVWTGCVRVSILLLSYLSHQCDWDSQDGDEEQEQGAEGEGKDEEG